MPGPLTTSGARAGGRRVAAAADDRLAVDEDHPDAGQVADRERAERGVRGGALRGVDEGEVGLAADGDRPGLEPVDPRGVAGGEADGHLGRDAAERGQVGHRAQDPERHDAGPRRRVVAQDHAVQRAGLAREPDRVERRPAVAAVDDLDRHPARDQLLDVGIGEGGRAAVDVADDVRAAPRARRPRGSRSTRRSTGRRCGTSTPCRAAAPSASIGAASAPVFTEPRPTSPIRLTPAAASSAKSASSSPSSRIGAPAWTLTPAGRTLANALTATIASALSPTMSLGRPGRWTSPAEIIEVTPPCSSDSMKSVVRWRGVQSPNTGMDVRVDEPGKRRRALAVDDDVGVLVDPPPDGRDPAVLDQDRVGVEQRARRCRPRRPRRGR